MAAIGLRFTDGTTTVTVSNGSTGWLTSYKQGSENSSEKFSTDRARVVLLSSLSTIQATIVSLNKLFRQAKYYQENKIEPRVRVERDLGDGVWWRSEILEALPLMLDSTVDMGLPTGKAEFDILYTRLNYWEGAEAQIPLTNTNGTDDVAGLTVYPIDDTQAGKDNFVDIDGVNDVTGDLPTPIRIEIRNTYNDADPTSKIFLSLNVRSHNSSGTWLQHILEGEDMTSGATDKPAMADYTLYSNGQYGEITVATTDSASLWTLDSAFLKKALGGRYRVYACFKTNPSADTWVNLEVENLSLRTLYQTDWLLLKSSSGIFQEIGVIEIPLNVLDSTLTFESVTLQLHHKCPTGATTLELDYIQLFPMDGWRWTENLVLSYQEYHVDRQYEDLMYDVLTGGSAYTTGRTMYGGGILLEPGVNQRLYIVCYASDLPLRTSTVKAWYRPRRLVL